MPVVNKKKKKCSKLILLRNISFGLLFVFVASINDNPKNNYTQRQVASVPEPLTKKQSQFLKNNLLKRTHKLTIPMVTHISASKSLIKKDEITLIGHLKSNTRLENIRIQWLLPEGVEMIDGTTTSFVSSTKQGDKFKFKIRVKTNNETNDIIHLVAKVENGNQEYSNSSQYNTRLQSEITEANQALYERAKKYKEDQARMSN